MANPTKNSDPKGTTPLSKRPGLSMISQADLAEYEELRPKADRFKVVQERLKAAMDAGASVEPGRLIPKMTVYSSRRLVVDYIFDRLGLTQQQIRKLRAEAPEVRYRSFSVAVNPAAVIEPQAPPPTLPSWEAELPREFDPDPDATLE